VIGGQQRCSNIKNMNGGIAPLPLSGKSASAKQRARAHHRASSSSSNAC